MNLWISCKYTQTKSVEVITTISWNSKQFSYSSSVAGIQQFQKEVKLCTFKKFSVQT